MIERVRRVRAQRAHRRLLARLAGPQVLRAFAATYDDPFFVEIGANDGLSFDHLHDLVRAHGWAGIMVEPVPHLFERLRHASADLTRVHLENAAVSDRDGTLPFFHLREVSGAERDGLPDFYDLLGSFSREAIVAHEPQIPDIRDRIVEAEVEALTFDRLMQRHGNPSVDLLVIDTEGHDYAILRSIDWTRHRPRLVVYEHFHFDEADRRACASLMRDSGYATFEEGMDTFCLREPEADDTLARHWRSCEPQVPGVTKATEGQITP